MTKTPEKASLTSQSAWLVVARVIAFIFSLILPLIVVRRLSLEAVGVYRQSFQVAGDAATVLSFGFNMSAFYYFNRAINKRSAAALNILLFNFATGAVAFLVLLLYPGLLYELFQSDTLVRLAPKIGLLIWFWLFSSFIEFAAVANQESRIGSLLIIGTQLSKAVLMIGALLAFETVDAIVNAALIQHLLQSLLLLAYLNSRFPRFWSTFDARFFREHAVYAIPFGFAGILWTAQTSIHFYFVGHRFSEADYAIYAYGCFQIPLVAILAESAAAVLLPRMSELQSKGDYDGMTKLMVRAIEKLSFYYFAIYAYLFVVSDVFITTLFTASYSASVPIFVIYLSLIPLSVLLVDPIFRSFEALGKRLILLRVVIVSILVAVLYGFKSLSMQEIVLCVVLVSVVDRFACLLLASRKLGLRLGDLSLFKGLLGTAVSAIVAGITSHFAFELFRQYLPSAFASPSLNLEMIGGRIAEFLVGSTILACTLSVFLLTYLLIAIGLNVIDEREKQMLLKPWRIVTG